MEDSRCNGTGSGCAIGWSSQQAAVRFICTIHAQCTVWLNRALQMAGSASLENVCITSRHLQITILDDGHTSRSDPFLGPFYALVGRLVHQLVTLLDIEGY